jgi:hypothetical protein
VQNYLFHISPSHTETRIHKPSGVIRRKSTESVCPQARGKSGVNAIVPGEGSEMVKRLASEKKRRRGADGFSEVSS